MKHSFKNWNNVCCRIKQFASLKKKKTRILKKKYKNISEIIQKSKDAKGWKKIFDNRQLNYP